jgi:hypothetical protein
VEKYTVTLYSKQNFELWNSFIDQAKNATFLFNRNFMEYHSDRFQDFSMMIFNEKQNLVALLPANRVDDIVYSHQGLTYGGLVLPRKIKLTQVVAMFKTVLQFLKNNNVKKLQIKEIPTFYCDAFSNELNYVLFLSKAQLICCDTLSTLNLQQPYSVTKTRRESINRGKKNNLSIVEETNFELFWNEILIPNLSKKHQVQPVHTVDEIKLLHSRFTNNIRHFNVYFNNKIVAGTTVFINKNVAHPQYISGNKQKNELGSLDYLYHHLITKVFNDKHFFDFGSSNELDGSKLNGGLIFWKESFGAQTVTQHFYEIETQNDYLLENILI